MKTTTYTVNNEQESRQLAAKFAISIKPGDVVTFSGELGAGKSFFCREIIKNLCGEQTKVISPTFNLLQTYEYKDCLIYHFDLYRLKHPEEIYELGIEEALSGNICLIEWPELALSILPKETIHIEIETICNTKRQICVKTNAKN
jgi:tRNA threonylcarbamoyladenosine biosynthesis protein TsaE